MEVLSREKNGSFYGTTTYGEPNHGGTVFKITADGQLTTLYGFCIQSGCPDGSVPQANLVQDATPTSSGPLMPEVAQTMAAPFSK
jgi:uncharacterized repeat protein (TIGR03803 family)